MNAYVVEQVGAFLRALEAASDETGVVLSLDRSGPVALELAGERLPVDLTIKDAMYRVVGQ